MPKIRQTSPITIADIPVKLCIIFTPTERFPPGGIRNVPNPLNTLTIVNIKAVSPTMIILNLIYFVVELSILENFQFIQIIGFFMK